MKYGAFLARFQPPHKSHEWIINKMMSENDKSFVFVGSADKKREKRNPFTAEERIEMLSELYEQEIKEGKLTIIPLDDYSTEDDYDSDKIWGKYVYDAMSDTMGVEDFSLYYSDDPDIMLRWFTGDIRKHIDFHFYSRNDIFQNLSATKIRQALMYNIDTYLKENLSETILKRKEWMAKIIAMCNDGKPY